MKAAKIKKPTTVKRTPVASDARARRRDACEAARAERDRKLDALGLGRTFDQLRSLDDEVQTRCKGL